MSAHACFDEMNAMLKPYNAQIAHGFKISYDHSLSLSYFVQTEKLDTNIRSKKPPLVVMTNCPFCGVSLSQVKS